MFVYYFDDEKRIEYNRFVVVAPDRATAVRLIRERCHIDVAGVVPEVKPLDEGVVVSTYGAFMMID